MQRLNLPEYAFRTKQEDGKVFIFDILRKKWLTLTPEEWVRQNIIRYLIEELAYPPGSIGTEVGITVNGRKLRADGVVYDNYGDIKLLLEFKAPSVSISEKVFAQSADYNTKVGAEYILISNGLSHYCARVCANTIDLLDHIPAYLEIVVNPDRDH